MSSFINNLPWSSCPACSHVERHKCLPSMQNGRKKWKTLYILMLPPTQAVLHWCVLQRTLRMCFHGKGGGAFPLTKAVCPQGPSQCIFLCHACSPGLEQYQMTDVTTGNVFHILPSRTGLWGHQPLSYSLSDKLDANIHIPFSPKAQWEAPGPRRCDSRPGAVVLSPRQWGVLFLCVTDDKEPATFL